MLRVLRTRKINFDVMYETRVTFYCNQNGLHDVPISLNDSGIQKFDMTHSFGNLFIKNLCARESRAFATAFEASLHRTWLTHIFSPMVAAVLKHLHAI